MKEQMYDINSGLIVIALFISMVVAVEIGYRIGFCIAASVNESFKAHINSIQVSVLGILALILAFTFSLSVQRYDSRSEAVVAEANAISTAYLRAQLLPASLRQETQNLIREYVDLRVEASAYSQADHGAREAMLAKALNVQAKLWDHARLAVELEPNPVTTGLYIEALNDLIDNFGKRDAALNRHVPEIVLLLLYGTFLMGGGIVGFSSGLSGHRPSLASYLMVVLMVVLVFIILDLDRPRRGFIQVSQKSMVDLQTSVHQDVSALTSPRSHPSQKVQ